MVTQSASSLRGVFDAENSWIPTARWGCGLRAQAALFSRPLSIELWEVPFLLSQDWRPRSPLEDHCQGCHKRGSLVFLPQTPVVAGSPNLVCTKRAGLSQTRACFPWIGSCEPQK